jgi:hypothetical protein
MSAPKIPGELTVVVELDVNVHWAKVPCHRGESRPEASRSAYMVLTIRDGKIADMQLAARGGRRSDSRSGTR